MTRVVAGDAGRRELERRAAAGDPDAKTKVKIARCRSDECCYHDTPLAKRAIALSVEEVTIGYYSEPGGSIGDIVLSTEGTPVQVRFVVDEVLRVSGLKPLPPENRLELDCARCKAAAGEWCVTKSGNRAKKLHVTRGSADGYTHVDISDYRGINAEVDYATIDHDADGLPYLSRRMALPYPGIARRTTPLRKVSISEAPYPLDSPSDENHTMRMQPGQTVTIERPDGSTLTMQY
jgi:hypothetical protein